MEDIGKQILPPYQEEIAWVTMDEDQEAYHTKTMAQVSDAARAALQSGSRRLLGAMLTTGLTLPDEPWRSIRIYDADGFPLVDTTPPDSLTADRVYPKEARALQEIKASLAQGHRVWVYANYTDTHDQLQRLADVLTRAGISNRIMRASVDRQQREAWVAQADADGIAVCLSHSQLMETGVDLINRPTLLWLSTGYNLMRLRQASRRAWRIGQTRPCRVIFLAYQNTLQEKALVLMGRKLEAAFALEGQLSLEGLQSLAADDNANELARALVDGLEGATTDVHKIWAAAPRPQTSRIC
jgi:superfamily II DNA or RNA helicase